LRSERLSNLNGYQRGIDKNWEQFVYFAKLRTSNEGQKMQQLHCARIKLKPNSLDKVREWATEMNHRKDEALATLRDESIFIESFFLERASDGDYLIAYIRAESLEQSQKAIKKSTQAIDAYHQAFKKDCWESGEELELLVDIERVDELHHP
jgi:Family of unknown function (DUF6176)